MNESRRPRIAAEGVPVLLALAMVTAAVWQLGGPLAALLPLVVLLCLVVVFHDPGHPTPATPLGVVSPVDGRVVAIDRLSGEEGEGRLIRLRINHFGTYTARCPVEGKVMDLGAERRRDAGEADAGLWLRTDEGADVVLRFSGRRFGLAPRSLVGYGERVGQGQRCAYLRLTRYAELRVPEASRILVAPGRYLRSGIDELVRLPAGDAQTEGEDAVGGSRESVS